MIRASIPSFVLLATTIAMGQDETKSNSKSIMVSQVLALIEAKCIQCHGEQVDKPDGDFGYARDLERIARNRDYVVPNQPQKSPFFKFIRDGEMHPDDSDIPPLTAEEKQVFRQWILAGAPHQLPADWEKIASRTLESASKKSTLNATPDHTSLLPAKLAEKPVTIEMLDKPAGEIIAALEAFTKTQIEYTAPTREPRLSIRLKKDGTLGEALRYLALNGNLTLMWKEDKILLVPTVAENGKK